MAVGIELNQTNNQSKDNPMPITHKERMQKALAHQALDRLPTQVNYTSAMGKKMAAHFGVSAKELPHFLGNHMIRVDLNDPARFSADGLVKFDGWGAGFDTREEGYFASVNPLKTNPDLDHYPWPNPNASGLFDQAQKVIKEDGGEHFITPNLGFALFERAWTLRGFEQFFVDMSSDPGYTGELLDRITAIQLELIKKYISLGVDGAYFGDDYGAQDNLLFSPAMWRSYIKPRLARLFAPFVESGLPILMHSDGKIQKILPDLVEIGLTALNPVQPEVLDHAWLAQSFKGKLAFYGGISTQTVLPSGTAAAVREAVAACVNLLAPDGTGLVIAPSHRMMSDIPMENVAAMLDAFARSASPHAEA